MRLTCPHCGERDLREFSCKGSAAYLDRPDGGAPVEAWDAYLHLRDNLPGRARDLFHHTPCGTWVVVDRDRTSHEIFGTEAASGVRA